MPRWLRKRWLAGTAALLTATSLATPVRAEPSVPDLAPGQVLRLAAIAGTGTATRDYNVGATDLCEFMDFPTELLQICGDSFAGQGVGFGNWHAPVAFRVDRSSLDSPGGVRYLGVIGTDKPLLADPKAEGTSQLPAGVVSINRENYLLITTTKDLAPRSSRLVKADAGRGGWATVPGSVRDGGYADGTMSQISGYYDPVPTPDSPTGWVYIVANNFNRSAPVRLFRVRPAQFTDRTRWQGYSPAGWGKTPPPLWPDLVGEMSFKQIDGKAVLSYFNSSTGNIEIRVAADPTGLGTAPVTTVVVAADWPDPIDALGAPEDNALAQPYGGYLAPGSTLESMRVFVSQWNTTTRDRMPYRVLQYLVHPYS